MEIGFLGTGNLAVALARAWAGAGHRIVIAGRNHSHAEDAAARIESARAVPIDRLTVDADVVVVAVAWDGIENVLDLAGAPAGTLAGKTVVDCTNAVDYTTGRLELPASSAGELVASLAPGAHVVKALHLFAGASWPYRGPETDLPVVAMCGDSPEALNEAASLVADLGATVAIVGSLDAARQVEEAAGFVMRVVAAGHNPRRAVPDVNPPIRSQSSRS